MLVCVCHTQDCLPAQVYLGVCLSGSVLLTVLSLFVASFSSYCPACLAQGFLRKPLASFVHEWTVNTLHVSITVDKFPSQNPYTKWMSAYFICELFIYHHWPNGHILWTIKEVTTFFIWLNYLPICMRVHREWTTLLFQHWYGKFAGTDSNFIMTAIEIHADITFITQNNILNNHVKFGKSRKGHSV